MKDHRRHSQIGFAVEIAEDRHLDTRGRWRNLVLAARLAVSFWRLQQATDNQANPATNTKKRKIERRSMAFIVSGLKPLYEETPSSGRCELSAWAALLPTIFVGFCRVL